MSLFERINAGEFDNKLPRPKWPVPPPQVIRAIMTPEQLVDHNQVCAQYEMDRSAYEAALGRYESEKYELREAFDRALCQEYEVDHDEPFAKIMLQLAWDLGHGNGYSEIESVFTDLLPLWQAAEKMVERERDRHGD